MSTLKVNIGHKKNQGQTLILVFSIKIVITENCKGFYYK